MKRACRRIEPDESRRDHAARWFMVLQDAEPSSRLLRRWQSWNSDPANRLAFDELVHLWRRLAEGRRPLSPSPAELAADDYDGSVSVAEWNARAAGTRARRRRLNVVAGTVGLAAVFASLVLGGMTLLSSYLQPLRTFAPMLVVETGRGEHRRIVLADGSRVYLGARSALTASITPYGRTVVLDRGEALFQVAGDGGRPFRVMAGRGTITAVGTSFNVRRHEEGLVVVTVAEGTVEVAPGLRAPVSPSIDDEPAPPTTVRRLDRGQQLSYDASGQFGRVLIADPETSLGWREGRLRYSGEPLHRVVADVNRYSPRSIIVGDRAAGELLYSGTVFEADVDDWITGLERVFPALEVIATDTQHVLLRTRAASDPLVESREVLSIPAD